MVPHCTILMKKSSEESDCELSCGAFCNITTSTYYSKNGFATTAVPSAEKG